MRGGSAKAINVNIENCYNAEKCVSLLTNNPASFAKINIKNTYYNSAKTSCVGAVTEGTVALNEEEMKNHPTFIQTLNSNIGENTDWKQWKIGEDGWPTFV